MDNFTVVKHDGTTELLDLSKAEKSLQWAIGNATHISAQDIIIESKLHLFDGISTSYILDIFIKTTYELADLTVKGQEYWNTCKNLMLQRLYKQVFQSTKPMLLHDIVSMNVELGYYTADLLKYTSTDFEQLEAAIEHSRDFTFTASGLEALLSQYTLYNNNIPIETPQILYMAIAMDIGAKVYNYNVSSVIEVYEALSTFKVTLPTPEMLALRTGSLNIASCEIVRCGDSIDSWVTTDTALVEDTVQSKGIGIHIGDIATVGDAVKNGTIKHSGKIPILRSYEALVNKASQNNRRGTVTAYVNFFDPEIVDILSLKSVRTAADKRINQLSYGICLHQLVYDRALRNEDITLISSRDLPDIASISEALASPDFEQMYLQWEKLLPNNERISARWLLETCGSERSDNSAYYIFNIDNANKDTMFNEPIVQANVCVEYIAPTKPLSSDKPDEPAVGICVLGNINQAEVSLKDLPHYTKLLVEIQTKLSLMQVHATSQANAFVKHYRDIGIGFSNHAYWLAKQGLRFGNPLALARHNEWMEYFTYYLLQASCELAKELGQAPGFNLASTLHWIENRQRSTDIDWEFLLYKIRMYGLANCGLSMLPPSNSSSIPSNQTASMEPIRDLITIKDKSGINIKQFAPEPIELADKYDFAYGRKITKDYLKHVGITQHWMDKGTSTNTFYNPELYTDKKIPLTEVIEDIYFAKKLHIKSLYYHNNKVEDAGQKQVCEGGACEV